MTHSPHLSLSRAFPLLRKEFFFYILIYCDKKMISHATIIMNFLISIIFITFCMLLTHLQPLACKRPSISDLLVLIGWKNIFFSSHSLNYKSAGVFFIYFYFFFVSGDFYLFFFCGLLHWIRDVYLKNKFEFHCVLKLFWQKYQFFNYFEFSWKNFSIKIFILLWKLKIIKKISRK